MERNQGPESTGIYTRQDNGVRVSLSLCEGSTRSQKHGNQVVAGRPTALAPQVGRGLSNTATKQAKKSLALSELLHKSMLIGAPLFPYTVKPLPLEAQAFRWTP